MLFFFERGKCCRFLYFSFVFCVWFRVVCFFCSSCLVRIVVWNKCSGVNFCFRGSVLVKYVAVVLFIAPPPFQRWSRTQCVRGCLWPSGNCDPLATKRNKNQSPKWNVHSPRPALESLVLVVIGARGWQDHMWPISVRLPTRVATKRVAANTTQRENDFDFFSIPFWSFWAPGPGGPGNPFSNSICKFRPERPKWPL